MGALFKEFTFQFFSLIPPTYQQYISKTFSIQILFLKLKQTSHSGFKLDVLNHTPLSFFSLSFLLLFFLLTFLPKYSVYIFFFPGENEENDVPFGGCESCMAHMNETAY